MSFSLKDESPAIKIESPDSSDITSNDFLDHADKTGTNFGLTEAQSLTDHEKLMIRMKVALER